MPLDKQIIHVPFAEGLDTKTDDKQTPVGRLTEAENVVFNRAGRLERRHGTRLLSRRIEGTSTNIGACEALLTFGDELLLADGENLYTYLASTDAWRSVGPLSAAEANDIEITHNTGYQINPDVAIVGGFRVVVWQDSSGGVRYSVVDDTNGAPIVVDTLISATGVSPKVVVFGSDAVILYAEGSNMRLCRVNAASPTVLSAVTNPFTTLSTLPGARFDAVVVGSRIFVAYDGFSGSQIFIDWIDATYSTSGAPLIIGFSANRCITVFSDAASRIWVVWSSSTPFVRATVVDTNLATVLAPVLISTLSVSHATGIVPTGATSAQIFLDGGSPASLAMITLTLAGAATAPVFQSGQGLVSKAFQRGASVYVFTAHQSTYQSTYFMLRYDPVAVTLTAVGKVGYGLGGGYRSGPNLSEVVRTPNAAAKYGFAALRKSQLLTDGGKTFTRTGVTLTDFDFGSIRRHRFVEFGRNLLISGGVLRAYDGMQVLEHGFHLFPDELTATPAGTGGSLSAGQYQYVAIYERTDKFGHVHRSAPSPVSTVTAVLNDLVNLTIPTLRLTASTAVRIVLYRTLKNGTTYYRLTDINSPLANDTTVDTVAYADGAADVDIRANEVLYTTGGILSNLTPDGAGLVAVRGARAFLAGFSDPNVIQYSKTLQEGEAIAFAGELRSVVDPVGGRITAIAAMDAYTIIFKENAIYYQTGDGPNDAGFQSDYGDPLIVSVDVGCSASASVVLTPHGLMFQSSKGFYLLDRGLNLTYIGAPVEQWNASTCTGAILVPGTNRVVFLTSAGLSLVYDHFFRQWSTFTGAYFGVSAVVSRATMYFAHADGRVYVDDATRWDDGGSVYRWKITRAWWSFAGLAGYQRIYRFAVLGEYKGPHRLFVRVGYDFNPTWQEERIVDVGAELAGAPYGTGTYGSGTPFGGEWPLDLFEFDTSIQQVTSFRVQLEEVQGGPTFGEALSMSEVAVQVGVKQGLHKIRATRSLGTA